MDSLRTGVYHIATGRFSRARGRRARLDRSCRAPSVGSRPERRQSRGVLCGASRAAQKRRTSSGVIARRLRDDARDQLLAATRVGGGDDAHVGHAGHRAQDMLHLGRTGPSAGNIDERRDAADQDQPSARVEAAAVAGQKSAVDERVRSRRPNTRSRRPDSRREDGTPCGRRTADCGSDDGSASRSVTVTPGITPADGVGVIRSRRSSS